MWRARSRSARGRRGTPKRAARIADRRVEAAVVCQLVCARLGLTSHLHRRVSCRLWLYLVSSLRPLLAHHGEWRRCWHPLVGRGSVPSLCVLSLLRPVLVLYTVTALLSSRVPSVANLASMASMLRARRAKPAGVGHAWPTVGPVWASCACVWPMCGARVGHVWRLDGPLSTADRHGRGGRSGHNIWELELVQLPYLDHRWLVSPPGLEPGTR